MSDDKPKSKKKRSKEASNAKARQRTHRKPSPHKASSAQRRPSMAGRRKTSQLSRHPSKPQSAPGKSNENFNASPCDTTASIGARKSSKRMRHTQAVPERVMKKFSGIDLSALGIHNPANKEKRRHITRIWLTSTAVVVIALFLLVGGAMLMTWRLRRAGATHQSACDSKACSQYAAIMGDAIDEKDKPCDNYYRHVCGIELKRLKEGASVMSRIRITSFVKEATRIYNMKVPAKQQSPLEKAAAYLQACIAVIDGNNIEEVKTALRAGGILWPDAVDPSKTSLVSGIVYMSAQLYTTVLVRVKLSTSSDGRNTPSAAFDIDSNFLEVMRMMTKHRVTKRILGHFSLTYANFASSSETANNRTRSNELFNDLVEIGRYFKDMVDYEKLLKDSSEVKFDPRQIATMAPSTDYETWNAAFALHFNESLDNVKSAGITYPKYFTSLFQAHSKFGATRILNVFGWLCIQSLIHYTSGKLLASYYFSSEEQALDAHRKYCAINTYASFRYAINVDNWNKVPEETLQYVVRMANDIWEAFQELLSERNGTLVGSRTPPSRDAFLKAILRHKNLTRPELITPFYASVPDMTKGPLHNYVAVKRAMAGHSRDPLFLNMNQAREMELSERLRGYGLVPRQLDFPWGIPAGPHAVALAGLGLRMAATLYFQSVDRLPNANQTHSNNFRCLAPGSKDEGGAGQDVPAAAAALRIVWRAWKTATSKHADLAMDLGPVPSDAVLFAFHCWFSCGPQPYNEMLCNVPVKHSREFAQLYGCAKGSGMNPVKMCPISV